MRTCVAIKSPKRSFTTRTRHRAWRWVGAIAATRARASAASATPHWGMAVADAPGGPCARVCASSTRQDARTIRSGAGCSAWIRRPSRADHKFSVRMRPPARPGTGRRIADAAARTAPTRRRRHRRHCRLGSTSRRTRRIHPARRPGSATASAWQCTCRDSPLAPLSAWSTSSMYAAPTSHTNAHAQILSLACLDPPSP